MTAAHQQRISDRRRLRLQSLCEGVRKGKKLRDNPKRREQWEKIQKHIQSKGLEFVAEDCMASSIKINGLQETAEIMAEDWKKDCQAAGIGVGLLSWLFWNFFLPILIQLAKDWLEEMAAETSQVTISGVASGSAEGRT